MEKILYPKEIHSFFKKIVTEIKEVLCPDYILIAGSFGKESWLYCDDELLSDFEFVFICKKAWSLKKKSELLKKLNVDYPYEISLKGFLLHKVQEKVISNYASKKPGYISLDFFDSFNDPVFLYNKNNKDLDVDCEVDEIPVWEAWRLYVNRMGDLLKLEFYKDLDKKTEDYYWLKIFESAAGAYCIINKIYNKNISKRLEVFNRELIENDNELNEICKNSFPIIQQALLARDNHDISIFKNDLSIKERKLIVSSWMGYFEKKLTFQEQFSIKNKDNFHNEYLNNKALQNKYLGFDFYLNKLVSNIIRLIYNPKLLNFSFKFYNHNYSWRHVILLGISSAFYEDTLKRENFPETRKILNTIFSTINLSDVQLINKTIYYWRILR